MKKIIAAIFIAAIGTTSMAFDGSNMASGLDKINKATGEEGIQFFQGTWKEALKKADKEDKIIFLDAYASWCGPCKLMASKTFTDSDVGEFFNENFLNVKMDMEKNEEGPRLSRKFQLTAYPSLYFIDKNEEVVYKTLGYHKPKQLIAVGEIALEQ